MNNQKVGILVLVVVVMILGCNHEVVQKETEKVKEYESLAKVEETQYRVESEKIAECYREVVEHANRNHTFGTLEMVRTMVTYIGMTGVSVVDVNNQIDMRNADQIIALIEAVKEGSDANATLICVDLNGGLIQYEFQSVKGKVSITSSYATWNGKMLEIHSKETYEAYTWEYTEEGYLFFEKYYAPGYDGPSGRTAVRVKTLDETCRALNRKYILPISYQVNNLFIENWSEYDFDNLNFYDIFDTFYSEVFKVPSPYRPDDNFGKGAIYQIPKEEFEQVIMSHFKISSQNLQEKTNYHEKIHSYEYRPRSFFDCQLPNNPFPEVVKYVENQDGTLTLTVNVVDPERNLSKAYTHEIVIRPLEEGQFQYVSNRRIASGQEGKISWYVDRLTQEEWEEMYGEVGPRSKGYDLPIPDGERKEAEVDCKKRMEAIFELYREAEKGTSSNVVVSNKVISQMQDIIKEAEVPVTSLVPYTNMDHYEEMENFLEDCRSGKRASCVLYEIHLDGGIGRRKYLFDGRDMYVFYAKAVWNELDKAQVVTVSFHRIEKWNYTKEGWFCYEVCVPKPPEVTEIVDGSYRVRIKPMSEKERELSEKCVLGLGYQGNNLLCSNWDTKHLEDLDYNGMYEYLYRMKYQKHFPAKEAINGIAKEEFERVIMEYIPITGKQLQQYAVFDEEHQTYAWASLGCFTYSPTFLGTSIPEVIAIKEQGNGILTLTVVAICDRMLVDNVDITHELTVQFLEDGSFQYLGNKILGNGLEQMPDYQFRF